MRRLMPLVGGLVLSCMVGSSAFAGGFEYNENGARILGRAGAWGAKADDPMAIHYNPAGLTNWRGHKLLINAGLTYLDASLTMLGMDEFIGPDKLFKSADVENSSPPFFAPSLAWGYSHGDWAVGAAVYGPSAYGTRDYGKEGPQQFMLSNADMLLAYVSASFSYRPIDEFSFGVTLQYVTMPYAKFGLTIDGAPFDGEEIYSNCPSNGDPCKADTFHSKANLDVSDWAAFAAIVGFHFRPTEFLEIGLSSRVTPIELKGGGPFDISFEDEAAAGLFDPAAGEQYAAAAFVDKACTGADGNFDAAQPGCKQNSDVSFSLVLPPWLRVAARYIHLDDAKREVFDIELDVVVEFWSLLQQYDIAFEGQLKVFGGVSPLNSFALPRKYQDTVAVRLGSDVNIVPDLLTLHLGAHWESAASPLAYSNIDFAAFMRYGAALGLTVKPIKELEISLAYQLIRQPSRTVTPEQGKAFIQRPLSDPTPPAGWDEEAQGPYPGLVANAAVYHASTFHSAALSFLIHWGE